MKKVMFAGLVCAVFTASSALIPGLQAATLTVTNANDSGPGSLRDAIALASPSEEIQFDPGLAGAPIVLTTGELLIDKNLAITGLGQDQTILDGNGSSRIFKIVEPAVVTLSLLTIRNGFHQEIVQGQYEKEAIAEGGGIYNAGTLTLDDSSIQTNTVSGLICDIDHCRWRGLSIKGGGIYNRGTLNVNRGTINNNRADDESREVKGGGIYNRGQATLIGTTISNNAGYQDRYDGLQGIGIYNEDSGVLAVRDGSVIGNSHGSSAAIVNLGSLTMTHTTVERNGWWRGGGLDNQGTAIIVDSTVTRNWTGIGGYYSCFAAGITNGSGCNSGYMELVRSAVSDNEGEGVGGINNRRGTLRITDSTIMYNEGGYFPRAGGLGSECASPGAMTIVENSTIAGNRRVGVKASPSAVFQFNDSVIAGNVDNSFPPLPDDCEGSVTSQGNNILGDSSYCQGFGGSLNGDVVGTDWTQLVESRNYGQWRGLVPLLADNGGPTYTVALLPGSPAIDAVPLAACTDHQGNSIIIDQRGVPRPQGAACDIGAFEFSWPRGAGFWAHQCSDRGFHQLSAEELQGLFTEIADTSSVFPECAPIGCEALNPQLPRNDLRLRAQQQLLDVWLNLVSGRLTRGRPIDFPGLTEASTVTEALSDLEIIVCDPLATRSDLANAKDIAEALNGSGDDMELAVQESTVTLLPGATRTVALGLINMSPANRNYSLTVSGPWPVQLSATRINALGSGQVAQITATITAPRDAQATNASIRITATDLPSQGTLSRDAIISLRLAGSSSPHAQPAKKPTQDD